MPVIRTVQRYFQQYIKPESDAEGDSLHAVRIATAVLLEEMMRADYQCLPEEKQTAIDLLQQEFQLTKEESREIGMLAAEKTDAAVSLHEFTSLIDKSFSAAQKIKVVEMLWRVAFADKVLDKYEEHLVRKIADLLHVRHKDFIQAKHRASGDV